MRVDNTWPRWLKKRVTLTSDWYSTQEIINDLRVNTVCSSACCPNMSECFSKKQATFLILGNSCTRNCRFCAVENSLPQAVDNTEPKRIAEAVKKLGLHYVVITSVTRDDLPDGGASQFVKTIEKIRSTNLKVKIEVLTSDFQGSVNALKNLVKAKPDVFSHNLETVPRLYNFIRPQAQYQRSLKVLSLAKEINSNLFTKTGLMLGLGEKEDEVWKVLEDLIKIKCDILTLGQYLRPKKAKIEVREFVLPKQFKQYERIAKNFGFKYVFSGPWVRSSYYAQEIFETVLN